MDTSQSLLTKQTTLRDLYPTLTDKELKEAEENLKRYCKVALEIHKNHERRSKVPDLT